MDLFGVDWSAGWAGNITAEALGVLAGLIVTYLVVDRVVRWQLNRRREPLRKRLVGRLASKTQMVTRRWASVLDMENAWKIDVGGTKQEEAVRLEMQQRLGFNERNVSLDELVKRNLDAATTFEPERLLRLAEGIQADLADVSSVADRYANVLSDDTELHALVGDLEEIGPSIESSMAFVRESHAVPIPTRQQSLISMCVEAFSKSTALNGYLARTQ